MLVSRMKFFSATEIYNYIFMFLFFDLCLFPELLRVL